MTDSSSFVCNIQWDVYVYINGVVWIIIIIIILVSIVTADSDGLMADMLYKIWKKIIAVFNTRKSTIMVKHFCKHALI